MSIMSNAKRALAIAAAAATLLSMAACGSSNAASGKSDSSGAASSGKIEVVASINQWGSVAEDLGGSNVEVTNIMTKTNVEAHDYEPTSQDVAKFGTAKVAVVNGADYDPWATKAAQPTKATLVTAAETAGRIRIYAGLAETVVGCALLLIGEHGICLTHLFELRLSGFIAGVAIRVVLHGKATIRFLDLVLRCPALNAEHLIVVLFSHGLLLVFRMNETLIRFLYVEKEPLDRIPPLLRQAS